MGNCDDVQNLQAEAFRHLAGTFFLDRIADDSKFHYEPMIFTPSESSPDIAKKYVRRVALMGGGSVVVVILLCKVT
jgi:hypothetical protein